MSFIASLMLARCCRMSIDERHLEKRLVDQHLNLMLFIKKKAQTRNGAGIHPEALCELLRASKGYVSATQLLCERFGREALLRRHHEEAEALSRREKEVLYAEGTIFAREHPAFLDRHDGSVIVPLIGNAEFAELPFYDFIRLLHRSDSPRVKTTERLRIMEMPLHFVFGSPQRAARRDCAGLSPNA